MAADRFIITRNVHLQKKNALIVVKKKDTSIRIVEKPKSKKGLKMEKTVNATSMENKGIKMIRKFVNDKKVCE